MDFLITDLYETWYLSWYVCNGFVYVVLISFVS